MCSNTQSTDPNGPPSGITSSDRSRRATRDGIKTDGRVTSRRHQNQGRERTCFKPTHRTARAIELSTNSQSRIFRHRLHLITRTTVWPLIVRHQQEPVTHVAKNKTKEHELKNLHQVTRNFDCPVRPNKHVPKDKFFCNLA